MGMEKVLRELDVTWAQMEFDHNPHPRTQITLLGASEELIETLEDNQVQLQNMLTSKYIAFFQEQVSAWQKKLSNADQVRSHLANEPIRLFPNRTLECKSAAFKNLFSLSFSNFRILMSLLIKNPLFRHAWFDFICLEVSILTPRS